jgi:YD repeat-containing protein
MLPLVSAFHSHLGEQKSKGQRGLSAQAGVGSDTITSSYSYDGANRLTGISYADATTNTPLASFTYGYNADGQVTSYTSPEGTLNYSYDKDGELTGVSGVAQASYSYDANGNRTMSGYQTGPGNELLRACFHNGFSHGPVAGRSLQSIRGIMAK